MQYVGQPQPNLMNLKFSWDTVNFGGAPDRRFAHEGLMGPAGATPAASPATQAPAAPFDAKAVVA